MDSGNGWSTVIRPAWRSRAVFFIRLSVGLVFFTQGILKYIDPNMGVNRFARIGFPFPHFTAQFVGTFESNRQRNYTVDERRDW